MGRDIGTTTLTFPVPTGLVPVSLKTFIEIPVSLRFGLLTIRQGDRTISRVPLPPVDQPQMDIPLNGLQLSGNWLTLDLTVTAVPIEGYCWHPRNPIRLVNGAITFAGAEVAPTTVATFLPAVLRKVTIGLPANPSPAESSAAVQVAAALSNRNGQRPEVVVVPLPDGVTTLPPSAPLERQVIVKEGPKKGLSLQGGPGVPALLISGPGNELAGQTRLLSDDSLRLAVSTSAVAETLPDQSLASDTTTLEQLIQGPGPTDEAVWPEVKIEIDQTRWGHPLGGVSVRLRGTYTPVAADFGGEVVISIAGESIDRWPAENAGVIDRTITIPDRLLKRSTNLEVLVHTTGDPGHCGDYLPELLIIDGSTEIRVQTSNPPAPQGFQSLPQALTPNIRIGIGPEAFADTARAAQIMVGLQRASYVPLAVEVTTLEEALASAEPAILISAGGWNNQANPLPFSADKGRITVTGLDPQGQSMALDLDPAKGFGSVQVLFDGKRTMLVATSTGVPGQLDELLRYLAAESGRWSGLNGRALIFAPGSEPIAIPNPPVDFATDTQPAASQGGGGNWFWWAVGGVAALSALGAVAILLRFRRQ